MTGITEMVNNHEMAEYFEKKAQLTFSRQGNDKHFLRNNTSTSKNDMTKNRVEKKKFISE